MKSRLSMRAMYLLAITIVAIALVDWVAGEATAHDSPYNAEASQEAGFAALVPLINHTAATTSTVYLPLTLKPGTGLRDFALPMPLFAANSAWNQTATGATVLTSSAQQILVTYRVLRGDVSDQIPAGTDPINWPYLVVNYDDYSVPIYRAGTAQQSVSICEDYVGGNLGWPHPKFNLPQLGGPVVVPAPAGEVRPSGPQGTDADGHLVIYDTSSFTAYDYFGGTTRRDALCQSWGAGYVGPRILEAGEVDFFDVRGPGVNLDTYSSARALGTPLLAGLLLPEDVESGVIAHALGFAIPGPRNLSTDPYDPLTSDYSYPASTTEGDFYSTNTFALAAGQRIRLKPTIVDDEGNVVDENQLAPVTQMILTALRTYGAYLVENAGGFVLYAEDIHTGNLDLTSDEVNALIDQPAGTSLPAGKSKWLVLMETIDIELGSIPIAYGPWVDGQDPTTAAVTTANFEVVDPATQP
jgi:hypothetical protein